MQPSAIFFDAAGTLIHTKEPVAAVYARHASLHGFKAETAALRAAFHHEWITTPPPEHNGQPSKDDDRGWWQSLVRRTLATALGTKPADLPERQFSALFTDLYAHYEQPCTWCVYDDVRASLESLQARGARLHVLSNFDRRLRTILHGHGLAGYFDSMIISSEAGASKPHPLIFTKALASAGVQAGEAAHVGDDEQADIAGAERAGIRAFHLKRPGLTLRDFCAWISHNPA